MLIKICMIEFVSNSSNSWEWIKINTLNGIHLASISQLNCHYDLNKPLIWKKELKLSVAIPDIFKSKWNVRENGQINFM